MEIKSGQVDQKTKISKENFPYKRYQDTEIWKLVEKIISDLATNNDLKEITDRRYIVGYLCQCLDDGGVLKI